MWATDRDILNEQIQPHSYKHIAWPLLEMPLNTVSENFSKLPWSAYTSLQHQPSAFVSPQVWPKQQCMGSEQRSAPFFSSSAQIQVRMKCLRSRQHVQHFCSLPDPSPLWLCNFLGQGWLLCIQKSSGFLSPCLQSLPFKARKPL